MGCDNIGVFDDQLSNINKRILTHGHVGVGHVHQLEGGDVDGKGQVSSQVKCKIFAVPYFDKLKFIRYKML